MSRQLVLMPILLLYMGVLVLSAWPTDVRPTFLDDAHAAVYSALESVGVRAGLPVFVGQAKPLEYLKRARCTIVTGVEANGKKSRVYPTDDCPTKGLRWKPVVYEHMIVHWTQAILAGDKQANLAVLADHFCQLPGNERFVRMELRTEFPSLHYVTGDYVTTRNDLGAAPCRRATAGSRGASDG